MPTKFDRYNSAPEQESYEFDYHPPPTIAAFQLSEAKVRCLIGPWGSAKSTGCCFELFRRASLQEPGPDGIRRSRWAVIRNTYPELKTTTLNTWLRWFPREHFGELKMDVPIMYYLRVGEISAEVIFLALDQASDVKKLLSLELTGAWINECREIPKTILDHLEGRVGRYPPIIDGGPTWYGVFMDTNPPDEDHWIPKMFGDAPPEVMEIDTDLLEEGESLEYDAEDYQLFKQPSGLSPEAENLEYLPGGRQYYIRMARGKAPSFIDINVHGKYGSSTDGKPVYAEYNDARHCAKARLKPNPKLPIRLGWDFGRNPCCIVAQIDPRGRLVILEEICSSGMGIETFISTTAKWHLSKYEGYEIISTADPSGEYKSQIDERTCLDVLRDAGIITKPAWTNAPITRHEAVRAYLTRDVDGLPGLLLSPNCKILRYGFKRGYRYKRVKVQGEDRYSDKVDKIGNPYTDPQDALQYLCLRMERDKRVSKIVRSISRKPVRPADNVAGY